MRNLKSIKFILWINSKALEGRNFFEMFLVMLMELRNAFCLWVHCMLWSRPTSYPVYTEPLKWIHLWNIVLFLNIAPQEAFLSRIYTFVAILFSTQKIKMSVYSWIIFRTKTAYCLKKFVYFLFFFFLSFHLIWKCIIFKIISSLMVDICTHNELVKKI